MNKSKSYVSLFALVAVLFTVGFIPYLTQDTFAQQEPEEPDLTDGIEVETDEVETDEVETDEVETTIPQTSISNLGQEVSNFVHESRVLFEQQKVETKTVIYPNVDYNGKLVVITITDYVINFQKWK